MLYIILAIIAYTIAILIATAASRSANTNLVTAVINTVSAVIPILVVAPLLTKEFVVSQKYGILLAVAGGVMIAVFSMALNRSYALVPIGIVAPLVFGGSIVLSAIGGYFIFGEKISAMQLLGLTLVSIGLVVIVYARTQTV